MRAWHTSSIHLSLHLPSGESLTVGERARNRSVTCCSHFGTDPHAIFDVNNINRRWRDERGKEGIWKEFGQGVMRNRTDTREFGNRHARSLAATQRAHPHPMHHWETYLKCLQKRMSAFPSKGASPSTWPSVSSDTWRRRTVAYSWITPTLPRQTMRRTHSAWGDSARKFYKLAREQNGEN